MQPEFKVRAGGENKKRYPSVVLLLVGIHYKPNTRAASLREIALL